MHAYIYIFIIFCNSIFVSIISILSTDNVQAGFRATGIYPLDRTKYKVSRLDKIKLLSYERWVESGKERDAENHPIIPSSSGEAANISHPQNDPEEDLPDPEPLSPRSSSSHESVPVSSLAPPLAPPTSSSRESIAAIEPPPPITPTLPTSSREAIAAIE